MSAHDFTTDAAGNGATESAAGAEASATRGCAGAGPAASTHDRRHSHSTRERIADVLSAVSGLEMQEALAEATTCECGEPATGRCKCCGAHVCGDLVVCIDARGWCWRCARPMCLEPRCPRAAGHPVTDTRGRCLAHHHAEQARVRAVQR